MSKCLILFVSLFVLASTSLATADAPPPPRRSVATFCIYLAHNVKDYIKSSADLKMSVYGCRKDGVFTMQGNVVTYQGPLQGDGSAIENCTIDMGNGDESDWTGSCQ